MSYKTSNCSTMIRWYAPSFVTLMVVSKVVCLKACENREGWWRCNDGGDCISRSQVCDGKIDCDGEEDEQPLLCSGWECFQGVRCPKSGVCIPVPHQTLCTGNPVCPDESDQLYCLHRVYTGCLTDTSLGLTISDCNFCFCDLKDSTGKPKMFKSSARTITSSHIESSVCIDR